MILLLLLALSGAFQSGAQLDAGFGIAILPDAVLVEWRCDPTCYSYAAFEDGELVIEVQR